MSTQQQAAPFTITRVLGVLGAILLATALLSAGGASSPAAAAPLLQCNGVGGGGGEGYDCSVIVNNVFDMATGLGTSTVQTIACNGPANTDPLPACIDSGAIPHSELTLSVDQCNGTLGGNGGSLYCSVTMVNTIIGDPTVGSATVNQCVGSLGGGGIVPGSVCDPTPATTSGATITQCNGSVNGGGGYMVCTVGTSTVTSAFDVSVTQCNGSAEGTGNLMVCSSSISTIVLPADAGPGDGGGNRVIPDSLEQLAETGAVVPGALVAMPLAALLLGSLLLSSSIARRASIRVDS